MQRLMQLHEDFRQGKLTNEQYALALRYVDISKTTEIKKRKKNNHLPLRRALRTIVKWCFDIELIRRAGETPLFTPSGKNAFYCQSYIFVLTCSITYLFVCLFFYY